MSDFGIPGLDLGDMNLDFDFAEGDLVVNSDGVEVEVDEESSEEASEDVESEDARESDDEGGAEEEVVEEVKEEKVSPRLGGIIRREKKLRDEQAKIESKFKEFEAERSAFEAKLSQYNFNEIGEMDKILKGVQKGDSEARGKLLEMVGASHEKILQWSLEASPEWVKANLKEVIDEYEGKYDPSAKKMKQREEELAAREAELNRISEARKQEEESSKHEAQVLDSAAPVLKDYPVCSNWDKSSLASDLLATIRDMYAAKHIDATTKLSDIVPRILPVLEQRYEELVSPVVSAVQSKRAKMAKAKPSKSNSDGEGAESKAKETPKKKGKTLTTRSSATTAKKSQVDLKGLSRSEAMRALAEDIDLASIARELF